MAISFMGFIQVLLSWLIIMIHIMYIVFLYTCDYFCCVYITLLSIKLTFLLVSFLLLVIKWSLVFIVFLFIHFRSVVWDEQCEDHQKGDAARVESSGFKVLIYLAINLDHLRRKMICDFVSPRVSKPYAIQVARYHAGHTPNVSVVWVPHWPGFSKHQEPLHSWHLGNGWISPTVIASKQNKTGDATTRYSFQHLQWDPVQYSALLLFTRITDPPSKQRKSDLEKDQIKMFRFNKPWYVNIHKHEETIHPVALSIFLKMTQLIAIKKWETLWWTIRWNGVPTFETTPWVWPTFRHTRIHASKWLDMVKSLPFLMVESSHSSLVKYD